MALYEVKNIQFATAAAGRYPTLYFRSADGTGRLRQTHDAGAGLITVASANHAEAFDSDQKKLKHLKAILQAWAGSDVGIPNLNQVNEIAGGQIGDWQNIAGIAHPGYYHFEWMYGANLAEYGADLEYHPDNKLITHMSGGTVLSVNTASAAIAKKLPLLLAWFHEHGPEGGTIDASFTGVLKLKGIKTVPAELAITTDDLK